MITKQLLDQLEYRVTGACIEVHKALGPGLLESVYVKCLMHELTLQDIGFAAEQSLVVAYKGIAVQTDLRFDLFIEGCLVLECKAVQEVLPIHEAKLISYMNILQAPKGLMVNFHSTSIVHGGKKSYVNEYYRLLT